MRKRDFARGMLDAGPHPGRSRNAHLIAEDTDRAPFPPGFAWILQLPLKTADQYIALEAMTVSTVEKTHRGD